MQKRCRRPYPIQWTGLVGDFFANTNGQAEAIEPRLLLWRHTGLAVRAPLDERGDVGQALGHRKLTQVQRFLGSGVQPHVHLLEFCEIPLQGGHVESVVGDVVGCARIRADDVHGQHGQVLHPALTFLSLARAVAAGAVFGKQCAALGCQRFVDNAKQRFWPGGWFQPLQGFFDRMQIAHADTGGVAFIALQWLAVGIEEIQCCADAQRFADIARHWLLRRAVPLHPVERPHVPQLWVIHGSVGDAIVGGGNGVAEGCIGNSAKRIGASRAFLGGVEAAMRVIPGDFEERVERTFEVFAQLFVTCVVIFPQHQAGKPLELPWVVVSRRQAGDQCLSETAATQCRNAGWQYMLRCATINTHRLAVEPQFAGVASGASYVQILRRASGISVPGEAHGQVAGIAWRGFLPRINQETEASQVLG
ncbi:hypothetical protein D3C87_1235210 [compost metagenome]